MGNKKRTVERVPADLEVRCFDRDPFGTVTNVSEKGMFVRSRNITFPLDVTFDVTIPLNGETLKVPVKINRITGSNGYYDGLAVELVNQPAKYLNLVRKLRLAVRNKKAEAYREHFLKQR